MQPFTDSLFRFTPGVYKSLMQKCIRYRVDKIESLDGSFIETKKFLLVVVSKLINHKGVFIPDIQRYSKL